METLERVGRVNQDLITQALAQIRNYSPIPLAYIGEKVGIITLDDTLLILGIVYILVQIGYLVWKWRTEAKRVRLRMKRWGRRETSQEAACGDSE